MALPSPLRATCPQPPALLGAPRALMCPLGRGWQREAQSRGGQAQRRAPEVPLLRPGPHWGLRLGLLVSVGPRVWPHSLHSKKKKPLRSWMSARRPVVVPHTGLERSWERDAHEQPALRVQGAPPGEPRKKPWNPTESWAVLWVQAPQCHVLLPRHRGPFSIWNQQPAGVPSKSSRWTLMPPLWTRGDSFWTPPGRVAAPGHALRGRPLPPGATRPAPPQRRGTSPPTCPASASAGAPAPPGAAGGGHPLRPAGPPRGASPGPS